tara:strand:- start:690 stop:923 length:234 start_codon:yes stop_codon:yes gene_type:complete
MAFIRATYNSKTVTNVLDSSRLATNQKKYWNTEKGVSDTIGVWDDINNNFIPDGWYDEITGWLWPEGLDWSEYYANN